MSEASSNAQTIASHHPRETKAPKGPFFLAQPILRLIGVNPFFKEVVGPASDEPPQLNRTANGTHVNQKVDFNLRCW